MILRATVIAMLLVGGCERGGRPPAAPDGGEPPTLACPEGTAMQRESTTASWCARPDGKRHGPYVERYPDGSERTRGQHTDGARDGEWKGFWTDGKPRSVEHYDRGKPTGMWITFFADGTHSSENEHRADGSVMHRTFRPDGSKVKEGAYVDGVEDGEWTEWDGNGTPTKRTYARKAAVGPAPTPVIGIPECDRYVASMRRCIAEVVPEVAREGMTTALEQTIAGWQDVALSSGKDQLAVACATANEAAATAMRSMGCDW